MVIALVTIACGIFDIELLEKTSWKKKKVYLLGMIRFYVVTSKNMSAVTMPVNVFKALFYFSL